MARGEKLIFIGGVARSGTTLLQNILDSHPSILGGPQFGNIPDIIHLRSKLHERIKIGKADVFNSYEDIDNQICSLIENLLMPLLIKHKRKLLSEKTPPNITVFPELMELFPGAHFIHMIRDPRAVILSNVLLRARFKEHGIYLKYGGSRWSDFTGLTGLVKEDFLQGVLCARTAPERVLTVVYERLVTDPESETRRICKYLGIEWASDMLYPASKKHLGEKSMTHLGICYTKKSFNRDIDPTCIDKWKEQLTFIQKVIISYYFRDIRDLEQYGYDLSVNSFTGKVLIVILSYLKQIINMRIVRRFIRPLMNLKIFTKYEEKTHVP